MADEANIDAEVQAPPDIVISEPQEILYDKEVDKSIVELDGQLDLWSKHYKKDSPNQPSENIDIRSVDQALKEVNFPKYGLDENTELNLRKRIEAGMADHLYSIKKVSLRQWVINSAIFNDIGLLPKNEASLLRTTAQLFPEVLEKYKKLQ